jgi:hypothetical protein
MFYLMLESIFIYGKLDGDTDILVYTSSAFMNKIKQSYLFNNRIKFEVNDAYTDIDKACKARLDLFELPSTVTYSKILYLDTDIIVKGDLNLVFDVAKDDILYTLEEGTIDSDTDAWGKSLFGSEVDNYTDKSAFTSGILLFNNCTVIHELFESIKEDIVKRPYNFPCYDQPYIVYNAFKRGAYDNNLLKRLVVNRDDNIHSDKVIHHFPGWPGVYRTKITTMLDFLKGINNYTFKRDIAIYDVKFPPKKNTSIPLVGLCISYNYFDTLQFVLPVNYLHFEKIYLVTQEDDVTTIEFSKRFDNVKLLFYNFKNNGITFDKYGGINYAQAVMYSEYPDSWYVIFDSDILLPNNFVDILTDEILNPECIYGGSRANVMNTAGLLYKKDVLSNPANINWMFNNILHSKSKPPSILGCFQLYKKHCLHRKGSYDNCGYGDYDFCHDNFELFCNLDNLLYFHLGPVSTNWDGKVISCICDAKIDTKDLFFNCIKSCNNVYYNKSREVVKFGSTLNIEDDIWTCSAKMRKDVYDFFADKRHFKLAEIGAHKGYSTKIFSKIFSKIYAVDNSVEWTAFNKELNKDANNIEHVMLDLYKDSWDVLPEDIEVSFIDAMHSYEGCKSDIMNSLSRFKSLRYIVFDDYGVWSGVKRIVDELMQNKTLKFERFIGIVDVPGPDGIVKNTHEGIICSVIRSVERHTPVYTKLLNFKLNRGGRIKAFMIGSK